MRILTPHPAAEVVGLQTDGLHVTQVRVSCPFCGGQHQHLWHNEPDGLREASCTPFRAVYRIAIGTRERIKAMRTDFQAPDGVVGLVPLQIGFAFEVDGPDEDVIGVILSTTVGRFVLWLPLPSAIGVASAIVDIAEDREQLRLDYLESLEINRQDHRSATKTRSARPACHWASDPNRCPASPGSGGTQATTNAGHTASGRRL